jgi:hypothetical protein
MGTHQTVSNYLSVPSCPNDDYSHSSPTVSHKLLRRRLARLVNPLALEDFPHSQKNDLEI